MGTVAADSIELEAMRKHDSSWHPCQVSLRLYDLVCISAFYRLNRLMGSDQNARWIVGSDTRSGCGLIVAFDNGESEDMIFTKEDALARIRVRSTPLESDGCSCIKEGEHVLASQDMLSGSLFFDAEVEKVFRVRHSKRIQCRCTFEIKWLHLDRRGGPMTVPASSIMKLAINKVDTHPLVGEFLNSGGTLRHSGVSPFVSLFEDTLFETDLSRMLEKQIEEIGRLADVTKKGCAEDVMFEVKRVDLTGTAQHGTVPSEISSVHDQASPELNNSKRTTRRQSKVEMEMTTKIPPSTQPVSEEPNRQRLSPLGARAALASLMHKLPPKEDVNCTFQSNLVKDVNVTQLDLTGNLIDSDVCIQKISRKDSFLSSEEASQEKICLEHARSTASLPSDRKNASNKSSQTRVSSRAQNRLDKLAKKHDADSSAVTLRTGIACSVSDQTAHPMKSTRLTRSAIQKGIGDSNDNVHLNSSHDEKKITSATYTSNEKDISSSVVTSVSDRKCNLLKKTATLTNKKGFGHSHDEVDINSPHEDMNLASPIYTTSTDTEDVGGSSTGTLKTSLTCSVSDQKLSHPVKTTRLTRSVIQKGVEDLVDEVENSFSHSRTKLVSGTEEVSWRFKESKVTKEIALESTSDDIVTPQNKGTRRKKPVSSPSDAEINVSSAQEMKKKLKVSDGILLTQECKGGAELGIEDAKKKSISSQKKPEQQQQQRHSLRLKFLPHTRGQINQ